MESWYSGVIIYILSAVQWLHWNGYFELLQPYELNTRNRLDFVILIVWFLFQSFTMQGVAESPALQAGAMRKDGSSNGKRQLAVEVNVLDNYEA